MMKTSQFSPARWIAGSLLGLVVANLGLIGFVAAADVMVGHPPQFGVPVFALLVASAALALSRRLKRRADDASFDDGFADMPEQVGQGSRRDRRAPAYLSMTIIRRAPSSVPFADDQKGEVRL